MERISAGLERHRRPVMVPAGGTWNDGARPIDVPMRARTTRESEGIAVPPLLVPIEGHDGASVRTGMMMRNNTPRGSGAQMCTPLDDAMRTLTTAGHQSLVWWGHLLVQYNRTGQALPVEHPMGTLTTHDRFGLVSVDDLVNLSVEDCLFRMLAPNEIKRGMAFESDYVILGNRREQVRQCGNAVTPPAARDLVSALAEAITGEPIELADGAA
jgi:DNA (cytosine-5)-methyltransferase 1